MTDKSPQELAAEILLIAEKGEHFNMASWWGNYSLDHPQRHGIAAGEEPECGTTMCAAGWALHLSGWNLAVADNGISSMSVARHSVTGEVANIPFTAARLLGLSDDEAELLFHTSHAIAIEGLQQIADGRPFDHSAAKMAVYDRESGEQEA